MTELSLDEAVSALTAGQVVGYPTEAVYGLGCDPFNESAVQTLWRLKQRPPAMGLILVAGDWQTLRPFMAELSAEQEAQLRAEWPAPFTWVVPADRRVPTWLKGGGDTIALRWSAHPSLVALCSAFGGALVSTSANLHGQPPARSAQAVVECFSGQAGFAGVVVGELGSQAQPTPIRELTTGRWIRGG